MISYFLLHLLRDAKQLELNNSVQYLWQLKQIWNIVMTAKNKTYYVHLKISTFHNAENPSD